MSKKESIDKHTIMTAAFYGETSNLKLMHASTCYTLSWDERVCACAALNGQKTTLKWLHFIAQPSCPWNERVCSNAALGNKLELLKWLRSTKLPGGAAPWNSETCENAAAEGNLSILKWALEDAIPTCKWSKKIPIEAIRNGRFEVLQWLYNKRYPWKKNKLFSFAKRQYKKQTNRKKRDVRLFKSLKKIVSWMETLNTERTLEPIYE